FDRIKPCAPAKAGTHGLSFRATERKKAISRLALARAAPNNHPMASFEVQAPGARPAAMTASLQQAALGGQSLRAFSRFLITLLALIAVATRPAVAQSILRDAETEALLQDMMDPITVAAGLRPGQVRVHLLSDRSINAFVAGSQDIYVHSGLIEAADSANEVQGVLAHELGHIMGGHAIRVGEGAKVATGISLLSLLLGAAAMAAGGADAGMGIMMAGQQAA